MRPVLFDGSLKPSLILQPTFYVLTMLSLRFIVVLHDGSYLRPDGLCILRGKVPLHILL